MVLLRGVLNTGRTVAVIEDQIPNDLGSALEAAAWVSYTLRSHRPELEPLPDWFVEGERHWNLVPPVRETRAAEEKQRAYLASPRCYIHRDHARPLRRNLSAELSWPHGETDMTFSFDGRVLNERVHEVVASGDSWPSSYQVIVSLESKLPTRFESSMVEVSVVEGYVRFDRLRFGPCEVVA